MKKSQPNWALTAELSPFEGRVDQLSSMTKLLLGTTNVSGFIQYNQPTETKVALGKTTAIQLVANGVASHIVAMVSLTKVMFINLIFLLIKSN